MKALQINTLRYVKTHTPKLLRNQCLYIGKINIVEMQIS